MKPFLILQARPETEAADDEFAAILAKSGLDAHDTQRVRLDRQNLPDALSLSDYSGVILGGGPGCVSDAPDQKSPVEARIEKAVLSLMPQITAHDLPFLGCCYGIGVLAHYLGALVDKSNHSEPVGVAHCTLATGARGDPILAGMPEQFDAFVGHKEAVQFLPKGARHLVGSPTCPFQMIRYKDNVYATQFHPEADASGFETRINIYRHRGYFPPHEADDLIAMCRRANVTAPEKILRNFVAHYAN